MERLNVDGDLHDVIHDDDHWDTSPDRIKPNTYASLDLSGQYTLYALPRTVKIR